MKHSIIDDKEYNNAENLDVPVVINITSKVVRLRYYIQYDGDLDSEISSKTRFCQAMLFLRFSSCFFGGDIIRPFCIIL